jgi:predicted nucleotidyltransferase
MDATCSQVMRKIERQIEKKIAAKKGYRKKFKVILERMLRKVLSKIFSYSVIEIKKYHGNSSLGCDELGRDVEDGVHQYIEHLKARKLQFHTVIVLGSRVKGAWTPKSDVDITIIASSLPKEGRNFLTERLFGLIRRIILSDRPLYLGIEPSYCCSKAEFLERLEKFDIQALDAVLYGRVVYDDGFWRTVKMKYSKMEKKYALKQIPLKKMLLPV